ncbi:unnamed protein product [Linum tenue]|uniref:Uncharacterized protein n=1 Tax=Linum tenue TaxID=586396 RepID=A0AAV0N6A8_9ROSI|nr:unnamed protein product [Linum tenue]CAI0454044.1 unnamed protein product [Linum tenue]
MALRSSGRKLSFEILTKSNSLEEDQLLLLSQSSPDTARSSPTNNIPKKKRRRNKHKKSSPHADSYSTIAEDPSAAGSSLAGSNSNSNSVIESPISATGELQNGSVFMEDRFSSRYGGGGSVVCTTPTITVVECVCDNSTNNGGNSYVELRQRNVVSVGGEGEGRNDEDLPSVLRVIGETTVERELEVVSDDKPRNEPPPMPNGGCLPRLETAESLDWKRLMAEDPTLEKSPLNYFMDEIDEGNSLRRTTTLGSEKERERVYDTLFRLPWRCELLIDVGFFVCLDSFLSLLTVMPTRVLMTLWRLLKRQFQKLSAADWSDFGCFIVLASGVLLLDRTGTLPAATLNIQSGDKKKILTFIPLAPACVVIRVLTPVYAAHLPYSPLPWRLFWVFLLTSITFVMLTSLKIMIGMGLQKHASWYVNRCRRRKHHLHSE